MSCFVVTSKASNPDTTTLAFRVLAGVVLDSLQQIGSPAIAQEEDPLSRTP